jgi:hypothetical protein
MSSYAHCPSNVVLEVELPSAEHLCSEHKAKVSFPSVDPSSSGSLTIRCLGLQAFSSCEQKYTALTGNAPLSTFCMENEYTYNIVHGFCFSTAARGPDPAPAKSQVYFKKS